MIVLEYRNKTKVITDGQVTETKLTHEAEFNELLKKHFVDGN